MTVVRTILQIYFFAQDLKASILHLVHMSQEAITEIDMEVFSRRIGPYFSWLESRIESGWQQSESVTKDILKEVKYLATTMRARFILGVSKEDFSKEVHRTTELFELASEAFPDNSEEVEGKMKHFCKGVSEELGAQFIPAEYRTPLPRPPQPPEPHPFPMPEPEPMPEPDGPGEPDEEKAVVQTKIVKAKPKIVAKPEIKVEKIRVEKPVKIEVKKVKLAVKIPEVKEAKPVKAEPKVQKSKPKKTKRFFLFRWVHAFIYGED